MPNAASQSGSQATVLDYHRSEVECLHCVADRLVAGWSLASVSRLPSGAWVARFNRPRKSARSNRVSAARIEEAQSGSERMDGDG